MFPQYNPNILFLDILQQTDQPYNANKRIQEVDNYKENISAYYKTPTDKNAAKCYRRSRAPELPVACYVAIIIPCHPHQAFLVNFTEET